jgi:transcriptional regulator with XRE-family HTH domain
MLTVMEREPFAARLGRLAREAGLSTTEIASALNIGEAQAKRVLDGTTRSTKFPQTLELCRRLKISPWELAGEREPASSVEATARDGPQAGPAPQDADEPPTRAEFEELEADLLSHVEQDYRLIGFLIDALDELAAAPTATGSLRRAAEGLRSLAPTRSDGAP